MQFAIRPKTIDGECPRSVPRCITAWKEKAPVPCKDVEEWGRWFENNDRKVAFDKLDNVYHHEMPVILLI